MNKIFLILVLILVIFISGCVGQRTDDATKAKDACIQKCKDTVKAGNNLSKGPCLSNKIIEGWVCDVAHSPRQTVDDEPANQCSEFGKSASSFIEVDSNCSFIRSYP